MGKKFENQVVVITGGNSGIGLATARAFKAGGAKLVVTGKDEKTLEDARRELGPEVLVLRSDAASPADASLLFQNTRAATRGCRRAVAGR